MKILLKCLLAATLLQACEEASDTNYEISGTIACAETDYVLLLDGDQQDTIPVVNNKFTYRGTVDTVHMVYLKIPSLKRRQEFILEKGNISLSCLDKGELNASGARNNERYAIYKHGMDSTTDIVMALYQVYLKKETEEEKKQAMRNYNDAEEVRLAFMRKQLRSNTNYTGLMILKPIYRTDSIENLEGYLDALSDFAYTDIYQEVDQYHKAVTSASPGKMAPIFELPDSTGQMVSLESFRGKYVLLDFWFTGCSYCDLLVPHLKDIYADIQADGFEIIDISVDKKEDTWKKTVRKKDSPWVHLLDSEKTAASEYGMPGYPILVLIDREGKVAKRLVGYRGEEELRKEILSVMI